MNSQELEVMELSHFIWSELEILELKSPVSICPKCDVAAVDVMYCCHEIAEHLQQVVKRADKDWLDILYITCADVACTIHAFMCRENKLPTWADLEGWHNG